MIGTKMKDTAPVLGLTLVLLLQLNPSALGQSFPSDPSPLELLESAREFQADHRDSEALALYAKVLQVEPDHFDALCAASYLHGQVGKRLRKSGRERHYRQALELAEKALEQRPDHPESNFVMAWACGGIAMISGARKKAQLARKIRDRVEFTLEKDPSHHRAWYVLANWYYKIADANFLERAAARLLFGGLPQGVSFEKAATAYQKAVDLQPNRILYHYELALALSKAGRNGEALAQLEYASGLDPLTSDDPATLGACSKLMRELC